MFITAVTVFWFTLAVSAIHVVEEYSAGWVKWVNRSATPISIIHIGGTIKFKGYTPGMASAIILHVPLRLGDMIKLTISKSPFSDRS